MRHTGHDIGTVKKAFFISARLEFSFNWLIVAALKTWWFIPSKWASWTTRAVKWHLLCQLHKIEGCLWPTLVQPLISSLWLSHCHRWQPARSHWPHWQITKRTGTLARAVRYYKVFTWERICATSQILMWRVIFSQSKWLRKRYCVGYMEIIG